MRRAVALCGGGTKGAYEIGVWKAIREMDINYDIVTGSSIGSMNGALMVQQDFNMAMELWAALIRGGTVRVRAGGEQMMDLDDIYGRIDELKPTLKKYVRNRGIDVTPIRRLVERVIDEKRIRESAVDFGLVTVGFPSLKPYELTLEEIPEGMLHDYIMASSAIFPAFPMCRINNELYLDGCYYDNLPIDLSVRMGADEVIAVDLHESPVHPRYVGCPFVKYIKPSRKLGKVLDFDEKILSSNISLGYRDALKVFGKYCGFDYTFLKMSLQGYEEAAIRFVTAIALEEAWIARGNYKLLYKLGDRRPLSNVIESSINLKQPDRIDYFVRGAELCGDLLQLDKEICYNFPDFVCELRSRAALAGDAVMGRPLGGLGPLEILPALTEMKLRSDSAHIMQLLYNSLRADSLDANARQALMLAFPRELTAAIFLRSSGQGC